ncbi:unnamed protein product [Vitrella brassicaformis CCMP3155]|uniref:H(+)-exporting diphosphatase n=1 Tax=Vitrella brassicaformis (strain CCMP3155) TaxID=1169540 RepID=A0A0G4H7N3_VITBC|nr:unnamed protein product [Vitrella brassicaformis CCMP3155]|eukprot:CEM39679.1 unnamed protein product [Vitrella brassicaformis CCMP3155]
MCIAMACFGAAELERAAGADWKRATQHPFIDGIGDGTLLFWEKFKQQRQNKPSARLDAVLQRSVSSSRQALLCTIVCFSIHLGSQRGGPGGFPSRDGDLQINRDCVRGVRTMFVGNEAPSRANKRSKRTNKAAKGDVASGRFSCVAALGMILWICLFICCVLALVLNNYEEGEELGLNMKGEETSYIQGPAREKFKYRLPQNALLFSLAAGCFAVFTAAYFVSFILIQGRGPPPTITQSQYIYRGLKTHAWSSLPPQIAVGCVLAVLVGFSSEEIKKGTGFASGGAFCAGALLLLLSQLLGLWTVANANLRVANALAGDKGLSVGLRIATRAGGVCGLVSQAFALMGCAVLYLFITDLVVLVAFAAGGSYLAFLIRVGGTIFSSGARIGDDLIGASDESRKMEEDRIFQQQVMLKKAEEARRERPKQGDVEAPADDDDDDEVQAGFDGKHHPIEMLPSVGGSISEASGSATDAFESLSLALAITAMVGVKHLVNDPEMGAALPFWIAGGGVASSALLSFGLIVFESSSARMLRLALRASNMLCGAAVVGVPLAVLLIKQHTDKTNIGFTQILQFAFCIGAGVLAPELNSVICEVLTDIQSVPSRIASIAEHGGPVQVLLSGTSCGFLGTILPSLVAMLAVTGAFHLEGFYGVALLTVASLGASPFYASMAAFSAVSSNAYFLVPTVASTAGVGGGRSSGRARRRAIKMIELSAATSQSGKVASVTSVLFLAFCVSIIVLAEALTRDNQQLATFVGRPISEFSFIGLFSGVFLPFGFVGVTMAAVSGIGHEYVTHCKTQLKEDSPDRIVALVQRLVAFGQHRSYEKVALPLVVSIGAPLMAGMFLGAPGLSIFLQTCAITAFCLSTFLTVTASLFESARNYILYGNLVKDADASGRVARVQPGDPPYNALTLARSIGAPMGDASGPALAQHVKLILVFGVLSLGLFKIDPGKTWEYGFVAAAGVVLCASLIAIVSRWLALKRTPINTMLSKTELDYHDSRIEATKTEAMLTEQGDASPMSLAREGGASPLYREATQATDAAARSFQLHKSSEEM